MKLRLTVNQVAAEVEVRSDERLLEVLRLRLGLMGTKEACGRGECGSCTVLIRGRAVTSCLVLAARADDVETIEWLAGSAEGHALCEAFADAGAFQCGFCTPGQIVRGVSLLRAGVPDTDDALRREMSGNICRCTGYVAIMRALRAAARANERHVASAEDLT